MGFYEGKLKRLSLNNFILFLGILEKKQIISWVIREIQIKIKMRYHSIPIRMATMKKQNKTGKKERVE